MIVSLETPDGIKCSILGRTRPSSLTGYSGNSMTAQVIVLGQLVCCRVRSTDSFQVRYTVMVYHGTALCLIIGGQARGPTLVGQKALSAAKAMYRFSKLSMLEYIGGQHLDSASSNCASSVERNVACSAHS